MTEQHDAPEGGAEWKMVPGVGQCTVEMAHAMSRLDGYDHDRDMPGLQRWMDYWDAAVMAAPTPPAPSGLVDAVREHIFGLIRETAECHYAKGYAHGYGDTDEAQASAEHVADASLEAALDATLSCQHGGAVPAGDNRVPGLEFAADIADHWHQRFMTLAIELPDTAKASEVNALGFKAVGAKKVLDEIKAERARLAEQPAPAGTGAVLIPRELALDLLDYGDGGKTAEPWMRDALRAALDGASGQEGR